MDPAGSMRVCGRDKKSPVPNELALLIESQGAILEGGAFVFWALASGAEVTKVIVYGCIPLVLVLVESVFSTKQYQQANMDAAPLVGWIFLVSVFVGTLSF